MRRFWAEEGGQAVVIVATMMTTLIMFVGLAVDAGTLFSARRTMQEAADAAAYAGAVVLYQNSRALVPLAESEAEDLAVAAAVNDATLNGYTHNVNGMTVTIALPPAGGRFAGDDQYVEVTIRRSVGTALLPSQLTTVSVRAVAGAEPLNNSYAIMSLNRGPTNCAFETSPNADIHLTGGGILVNSSSPTAACNQQTTATRFTIAPATEGVDINGESSSAWPATIDVDTDEPQQADPLAGFPPPSTACTPNVTPCTPMTVQPGPIPPSGVVDPGFWTVEMGGAGNTVVYMNPGIYVLTRGINASGNADLISTSLTTTPACAVNCGVFIFNTHPNYPNAFDPAQPCGALNLTGNATTDLKAQTTGEYANFLVYQDPACTNAMTIAGNGSFSGTGTIYLPNAAFVFNGNNASLVGSQLVANTVNLQNGNITIDFAAGTSAQPILPRLAE